MTRNIFIGFSSVSRLHDRCCRFIVLCQYFFSILSRIGHSYLLK